MAQNKPRQHHYISKFLLENFTDDNGYFWTAGRPVRRVFQTTPHNLFKGRDLYVSYDVSPSSSELQYSTDYATREGELSELEGLAAPVINKIIDSARQGHRPKLSYEETRKFMDFFLSIYRRNPNMLDQITDDFSNVFYHAASMRAAETGYPLPAKEELCQDPGIIKLMDLSKQNTKSRFAVGDHKILRDKDEASKVNAGLRIIKIVNTKRNFIIGNCAFSEQRHGKPEPAWLPVASDIAIALIPGPGQEELLFVKSDNRGDEKIKAINTNSAAQSDIFVGRSETLVRSLIKRIG